jgi:hypothetical protein
VVVTDVLQRVGDGLDEVFLLDRGHGTRFGLGKARILRPWLRRGHADAASKRHNGPHQEFAMQVHAR